MSNILHRLVA